MSEFECSQGHITGSGLKCHICGSRITRMDGKTAKQLQAEDDYCDDEPDEDDYDDGSRGY